MKKPIGMLLFFLTLIMFSATTPCLAAGTVTAWGTLQIEGHALGFNVTGAKIILQGAPSPVLQGVRNKFEFHNVPTETPCQLIIEIQSPTTGETVSYRAAYKFSKAPLLAGARGKKASGYLGDFVYVLQSSQIKCNNRY